MQRLALSKDEYWREYMAALDKGQSIGKSTCRSLMTETDKVQIVRSPALNFFDLPFEIKEKMLLEALANDEAPFTHYRTPTLKTFFAWYAYLARCTTLRLVSKGFDFPLRYATNQVGLNLKFNSYAEALTCLNNSFNLITFVKQIQINSEFSDHRTVFLRNRPTYRAERFEDSMVEIAHMKFIDWETKEPVYNDEGGIIKMGLFTEEYDFEAHEKVKQWKPVGMKWPFQVVGWGKTG